MAGASIPLTPAVHQMINVGPIPLFEQTPGEISFPIVRDVDTNMYERQNGSDMEVGSYAHRPILMDADDIPSIEESALSPTELPFTTEDFDPQLEQALELMPDILTVEGVGHPPRDQRPALADARRDADAGRDARGEGPVVGRRGLDQGGARDRAHGRRVDDRRRVGDRPPRRRHRALPRRTSGPPRTSRRAAEGYNKTYGIVHPMEQWASNRRVRLSAVLRARGGARRRVLRDRGLGAAVVVRVERAARSRSTATA